MSFLPDTSDLVEALLLRAETSPDDCAYRFLESGELTGKISTHSYKSLLHKSTAIAASLEGQIGERALLLYPPGMEFVEAFWGCLLARVVAVPVYPPDLSNLEQGLSHIERIVRASGASVILSTTGLYQMAQGILDASSLLLSRLWCCTDEAEHPSSSWVLPNRKDTELALLQYTSGSTGQPRGVMVSHRALVENHRSAVKAWKYVGVEDCVSWLPGYHDMGLIGNILLPVHLGKRCTLIAPFAFLQRPIRWLQAISSVGASWSGSPNFGYELCLNKIKEEELETLDLSRWKLAFNGAEPIRESTLRRFARKFAPCGFKESALSPCYGLAEATLYVSGTFDITKSPVTLDVVREELEQGRFVPAEDGQKDSMRLVSSGDIPDEHEVRIVDPETRQLCASSVIGEIWLAGPSIADGYWEEPAGTEEVFQAQLASGEGSYLRTGDLGYIHHGELYVTGRQKDLLIVRGSNHYPQDIEQTAEQLSTSLRPGCNAAFAVEADPREQLVLVQELRFPLDSEEYEHLAEEIRRKVIRQERIQLDTIVFLEPRTIPKTSSGKIQRRRCRQEYLSNGLQVLSLHDFASESSIPATPHSEHPNLPQQNLFLSQIQEFVLRRGGSFQVTMETSLREELGLDSLGFADLIHTLEEATGRSVELSDAFSLPTVLALFSLFQTAEIRSGESPGVSRLAHLRSEVPQLGRIVEEQEGRNVKIEGRWCVDFASANYLGLDLHPRVNEAVGHSLQKWGVHPSWTRAVASPALYEELERSLAAFLKAPDVLVFPTITLLHMGVLPLLAGSQGAILIDTAAHNSLQEAAQLARGRGTRVVSYTHERLDELERELAQLPQGQTKWIVVDGVYSMSGSFAPLPALSALARTYNARLYVDDAHGFGVVGEGYGGEADSPGRGDGLVRYYGMDYEQDRIVYVGGMSKAFSSLAAFVTCLDPSEKQQLATASSLVYSGPCPVASLASACAGLEVNLEEGFPLRSHLLTLTRTLVEGARGLGLEVDNSLHFPLVSVVTGGLHTTIRACQILWKYGILMTPGLFPAVPIDRGLLRFTLTAANTLEQVELLLSALGEVRELLHLTKASEPSQQGMGGETP